MFGLDKILTLPTLPTLKSGKKIFVVICVFLLFVLGLPKQTYSGNSVYYVSPNGDDDNPGTINKPWQHINYAASSSIIKPGDTIYIRGGTYNESIEQKVSGAPGNYVTYRNYPNEHPIISDKNVGGRVRWMIKDESYIRIEGMTFQDYFITAVQVRNENEDVTDIAIVNNVFENQKTRDGDTGKSIQISTLKSGKFMYNINIEGNEFYNMDTGIYPALQIEGDVRGAKILNNIIEGTSNIAINIAGRPQFGQPQRILVKGNDVSGFGLEDRHAPGIYLDGAGKFIVVEDNIVHDRKQGIRVNLENAASSLQTEHVILRRNIIYNTPSISMQLGVGGVPDNCNNVGELNYGVAVHNTIYTQENSTNHWFSCGVNLRWKNNALVHEGDSGYQYRLENTSVKTGQWESDYNFFYSSEVEKPYRWFNKNYNSIDAFYNVSGLEQHSITGLPNFTNQAAYDFTLQAGSPLIDAGGPLTFTRNPGSGKEIPVEEVWYFSDGLGLQEGDRIRVGSNPPVVIVNIDYVNQLLIVDRAINWSQGTAVNYDFNGNSPDIGAFEFETKLELSLTPNDQALHVRWRMNDVIPAGLEWHLSYQPQNSPQSLDTIILSKEQNYFYLTNLENYQFYIVNIKGVVDGDVFVEETKTMMPTDIHFYLPIVHKN